MAKRTIHVGETQIGLLEGLLEQPVEAMVTVDERGALITVPQRKSIFELARERGGLMDGVQLSPHPSPVPEVLYFRGTDHCYVLHGCNSRGSSMVFGGNRLSQTRIRADRLISDAPLDVDYTLVNGLEAKIEGLATWSGRRAVSAEYDTSDPSYPAVALKGQNLPPHALGGPFGLTLSTSFSHKPELWGEVHQIRETLLASTRTSELRPLVEHRRVHIMLQDLMCLVFGKPMTAEATAVMRDDDQPYDDDTDSRLWRELYEPRFGRGIEGLPRFDAQRDDPLFSLADTEPDHVTSWIGQWDLWSRPTSIAVTTLFQRGTTAEAGLLQMAVAIEALGYAILADDGREPGELDNVQQALKAIFNRVRWDWRTVFGGEKSTTWADRFRVAYNGVKHANNPLPDPLEAHRLTRQGLTVMRVWQAHQLGVAESTVIESLRRAG